METNTSEFDDIFLFSGIKLINNGPGCAESDDTHGVEMFDRDVCGDFEGD